MDFRYRDTLKRHAGESGDVRPIDDVPRVFFDREGAAKVVDRFAAEMAATPQVKPIDGVSSLPGAKCFQRTKNAATATDPMSWQRTVWHFTCIARTDRYAFTTFSDNENDVKQQISAQYRILAGK